MQAPTYRAASRELLGQATRELAAGDSRQASEKAWGAAAQMVKAVAQNRGWQHNNHFLLFQTADRLAQETGDQQIASLFTAASGLHVNFYENWLPPGSVEVGVRDMEILLDKLSLCYNRYNRPGAAPVSWPLIFV